MILIDDRPGVFWDSPDYILQIRKVMQYTPNPSKKDFTPSLGKVEECMHE